MGDRGQVFIEDEGVWLYTHWGATGLIDDVKRALAKKWRWDDPEYLARIILEEMVGPTQYGTETGFGISGEGPHGDEWRIITVNCKEKTITIQDNEGNPRSYTFENFIDHGQ
jgi:hypothetical protein